MSDVKDVYVDKRTNIKKTIYDEHSYIVKIINIQFERKWNSYLLEHIISKQHVWEWWKDKMKIFMKANLWSISTETLSPIHIQPTNRPNGCFVVIFKVFYDIHKSSLNKKKWRGGRDKWNARVGVKPYDNLVVKNV